MKIIEKTIDMAGKFRVLVQISDTESMQFKFQSDPTEEEILAVAQNYVDSQNVVPEIPPVDEAVGNLYAELLEKYPNEQIVQVVQGLLSGVTE